MILCRSYADTRDVPVFISFIISFSFAQLFDVLIMINNCVVYYYGADGLTRGWKADDDSDQQQTVHELWMRLTSGRQSDMSLLNDFSG